MVGEFLSIWQKRLDNVLTSGLEIQSLVLFLTHGQHLEPPKTLPIVPHQFIFLPILDRKKQCVHKELPIQLQSWQW